MARLSLPKTSLLTKPAQYNRVYRHGTRLRGDNFNLLLLSSDSNKSRLGISIHGKLKGAVKRNRIKRIIREFFRIHYNSLPLETDFVFTVRKGFNLNSPKGIADVVFDLLRKTGTRS